MFTLIFLQAGGGSDSLITTLLFMGGIFLVFYLFMVRPQQKKQKDEETFRKNIKKGDTVVTIGGIHGKIYAIDEHTLTVEVDRGTKLVIDKTAVSQPASQRLQKT